VFRVADSGSSHRAAAAVRRMPGWSGNAGPVQTPVHASWLNRVGIYLSLLERKVPTPNDSASLQELGRRIRLYEELTNQQAKPFERRFTKYDLFNLLHRLATREAATSPTGAAGGV
jgi:hypothetical protein